MPAQAGESAPRPSGADPEARLVVERLHVHRGPKVAAEWVGCVAVPDVDAWMDAALAEARRAIEHDDVPVGAVVVHRPTGEVVARAHNERELRADPGAHA